MTSTTDLSLEQRGALLDSWVEKRRQIARLEAEASDILAERMRLCTAESDEHPYHRDAIHRSMVAEYAAAGQMSQGSVEYALTDAGFLADGRHPRVQEAFRAGAISAAHVREIVRAAGVVREAVNNGRADSDALPFYDSAAVIVAEHETPARTRAHMRELAAALAGSTTVERHARATSERTVTLRSADDGLSVLSVVLPEHLATAIHDRLTRLARVVIAGRNGDGIQVEMTDSRSIDQVRTDLLIDLLLTSDPSAANGSGLNNIQARIQVTVAATTLAGIDDRPAHLDGHGPLHPDVARDLAGRNGGWSRLFLDPSGLVVETDAYTPTESMRRFLRARDQHCRFPGCRMSVHRCQLDHTFDHAKGGKTEIHNLGHLCATHHALKHPDVGDDHRWTARQLPDGTIDWRSPLGRTYRDSPPRRVMFV